jgi:Cd2+/Zn2+-exporting ATPase
MTAASGLLLGLGFTSHAVISGGHAVLGTSELAAPVVSRLLYLGAVATGAWFVVPKAWLALGRLRPDMNLLMTVAVGGAVGIGEFLEAGAVAFLFALSLTLEAWSVGRARRAIAALMALSPDRARVLGPGTNEELR